MQTYQLKFAIGGRFQALPDSQTIFGAMCWAIRDVYGEAKLTEMLADFQNHPQRFVVSSMFYENTLPLPQLNINIKSEDIKTLTGFQNVKKIRKLKWGSVAFVKQWFSQTFDQTAFEQLLLGKKQTVFAITDGIIHLAAETITKAKVAHEATTRNQINRLSGTTGDEGQLFYQDVQTTQQTTKVELYIQTEDTAFIMSVFRYLSDGAMGRDKSVGLNNFIFESLEQFEFNNQTAQPYLLSKYLPVYDEVDWDHESLMFQTFSANYVVESRQSFTGFNLKAPLVYLQEGSIVPKTCDKPIYGQLPIVQEIAEQRIYQNGLGLFL